MKIVNQNLNTHNIRLVPRFYPVDTIQIHLFNEIANETFIVNCNYVISDGYLDITFDFDFVNKDRFSFKIIENNLVVYHGKIYSTIEETQNYKQTDEVYEY